MIYKIHAQIAELYFVATLHLQPQQIAQVYTTVIRNLCRYCITILSLKCKTKKSQNALIALDKAYETNIKDNLDDLLFTQQLTVHV